MPAACSMAPAQDAARPSRAPGPPPAILPAAGRARPTPPRLRPARSGSDDRMGRRAIAVVIVLIVLYVIVGELIVFGDELGLFGDS